MAVELRFSGMMVPAKVVLALGFGLSTGACSLSFPMPGFVNNDGPTGSIHKSVAALSPDLDTEDLRRARAALAVALDPQGDGTDVSWHNPQTGAKGSFVALAPPFVDRDRICRTFGGHVAASSRTDHHLGGRACRNADGDWILADIKEEK